MFKLFPVHVCEKTGFAEVSLIFNIGNGLISDKHSFRSQDSARKYITSSKRSYVLLMLERYINRQRGLFADFAIYNRKEKLIALEICLKKLTEVQHFDTLDICKNILEMEKELNLILPSINSCFYTVASDHLSHLISFCKDEQKS